MDMYDTLKAVDWTGFLPIAYNNVTAGKIANSLVGPFRSGEGGGGGTQSQYCS